MELVAGGGHIGAGGEGAPSLGRHPPRPPLATATAVGRAPRRVFEQREGALNQTVARNGARFPADFAFRLDAEEWADLKSQSVISSWGGRRSPPRAFTEHGALMAANVLRSPRAVQASIEVVRAFARLREILASHAALAGKLDELERRYDRRFAVVFKAIRKLMGPDEDHASRRIWFRPPTSDAEV